MIPKLERTRQCKQATATISRASDQQAWILSVGFSGGDSTLIPFIDWWSIEIYASWLTKLGLDIWHWLSMQDKTRGTPSHFLRFVLSALSLFPRSILRCHGGTIPCWSSPSFLSNAAVYTPRPCYTSTFPSQIRQMTSPKWQFQSSSPMLPFSFL